MKKWEQCLSLMCHSLKQVVKQTEWFWCLLATDRTNFSCSKFFLRWIEAEIHWKKNHKSHFGWKLALTVQWAQKVSATILVCWSLPQIRRPIFYFSSAQFTSITVQLHHYYNNFFPGPQNAFVKEENGTMLNWPSEKLRHTDKTLLSPCRLELETSSVQSSRNLCCLMPAGLCALHQEVTRGSGPSWDWVSITPMVCPWCGYSGSWGVSPEAALDSTESLWTPQ